LSLFLIIKKWEEKWTNWNGQEKCFVVWSREEFLTLRRLLDECFSLKAV